MPVDEQLSAPPRSRGELALRRRALWSDAGERAACALLGRWNGEFQQMLESESTRAIDMEVPMGSMGKYPGGPQG